jgi:soluble lytic murein transglycosylase-like protein
MPDYRNRLTDVIYQLESSGGKNKRAYKSNKYGALGGYQLTPGAYTEIQRYNPKVWGDQPFEQVALNDTTANQAASDYLFILAKQLENSGITPTNENLLAAYHSGVGNVKKGLGPLGRRYVSDARALAGLKPWESW